mmetsp:Transcript_29313/g.94487  ORF Transcript_29313/g.94487 Transcript_29313/m.94487 type:complete len:534 (+) Transcript_29313:518-2119(+)|eukprot:scaffold26111_cov112-Isochrysis_galbana.AAC.2
MLPPPRRLRYGTTHPHSRVSGSARRLRESLLRSPSAPVRSLPTCRIVERRLPPVRRRRVVRIRAPPAVSMPPAAPGSRPVSVRGAAQAGLEGLVQHLAQRRVRVDGHGELRQRGAVLDSVCALLDEICRVDPDDVHGHHLVRTLLEDDLGDALALALRKRLGVGLEVALRDAHLPTLLLGALLGLLLGGPNHGDLRVGEAGGRHGVVVEHVLVPAHILHRRDALRRRRMRQHHLAVEVPDAPQALDHVALLVERAHLLVDRDEAAIGLDVDRLQAQALRVGLAACAHHHRVNLNRLDVLLCICIDHLHGGRLHTGNTGRHLGGEDVHVRVDLARPDQDAVGQLRDLPVEEGHHLGHGLDEGNLGAESGVHVGKLQANVARADDGDPVGNPLELERLVRREDRLAVGHHARRHEGHRPSGQDDVLGLDGLAGADELYLGRALERSLLLEDSHAQRLERALEVALDAVRQVVCVVRDALAVIRDGTVDRHTERGQVLGVLHVADAARGSQERLRRDATAVHARPTDVRARAHCDL